MKSPFPGMDPFIEGCGLWGDFHHSTTVRISRALNEILPEKYVARLGQRTYVDITEIGNMRYAEEVREIFVEIQDLDNEHRLVTLIEVLSPANKNPDSQGWDLYQQRRREIFSGQPVNFVEFDLLRSGTRFDGSRLPTCDYYALVRRKNDAGRLLVWAASMRSPLPVIPIPLDSPDSDVVLDLQPMVDANYALSKYDRSINYLRPISPALGAEDIAWLEHQLKARDAET